MAKQTAPQALKMDEKRQVKEAAAAKPKADQEELINVQLREKVANLEETIGSKNLHYLTAELEEKVNEFACSEEAYERQANDLIEQDALIGQKLRETESDNFHLTENIKELMSENNSLLQKLNAVGV